MIYLQDRVKKGSVVPFDSVKDKIKEMLKAEKTKKKFDELVKSLREKTKVEYKE